LRLEIEDDVSRAEDDFDGLAFREQQGVGRGFEPDAPDCHFPFDPTPQQHIGLAEKRGDELVSRAVVDFKGRADLFDPPVVKRYDAVGKLQRLLLIVCDEERGDVHFAQQGSNLTAQFEAGANVGRAERLVKDHRGGMEGESSRQGHALPLPAGELRGVFLRARTSAAGDQDHSQIPGGAKCK